ncbi:hypothetical protein TNCV_341301 [Trichonephila clavipes]|nr:hypothetical protein TNCV_341301 [Trichonephila clavipes]
MVNCNIRNKYVFLKSTHCINKPYVPKISVVFVPIAPKTSTAKSNSQLPIPNRIDSITIQNNTLPATIHVLNDDVLPLDEIIGLEFLQQTQFTLDKNGIRPCGRIDDDLLVNIATVCEETTSAPLSLNLPHIVNNENCEEANDSENFKLKEAKKLGEEIKYLKKVESLSERREQQIKSRD